MTQSKILIPLDESNESQKILDPVRKFFAPPGSELILLQVVHPTIEEIEIPPTYAAMEWTPGMYRILNRLQELDHKTNLQRQEHLRKEILQHLEEEAEQLRTLGYTVSTQVEFGDAAERIEAVIEKAGVDLVAMTTHGREGVGRLIHGSVSGKIVHDLNIPVLLLHPTPAEE